MSRGMGDDEVQAEMRKMIAFIKQEALEKAREIKVKAEEDFAIEKAKIVRSETINIDAAIEKKKKQSQVQRKVASSNLRNKSRLNILQKRDELLGDLCDQTSNKLHSISANDNSRYIKLLTDLILQGLYQLMESSITLVVRKHDIPLFENAIQEAKIIYSHETGDTISIDISNKSFLPQGNAGGVIISGYNGRITIDNTLETRLHTIQEQCLPLIKQATYGVNPNRKFTN